MASVKFRDIHKSFGRTHILKGTTIDVADGEFLTLLGPSGCGKSTLLRILAGLESQDGGSLEIGGRSVDGLRPKERDVAMVFQSYALYPHMTVEENMAVPLKMRRLNTWQRLPVIGRVLPGVRRITSEIDAEVAKTAAALGINHLVTRKPGQLSGGQRQRVAVGRAMVRHPAVFLMDEPLSNLDAKLRVQMRAEIKDLHRRLGVTFIYVTHDQSEAMTLSDRVAVMNSGELLQVAPPQVIYSDPNDRRVAEFIGSPKINILEAKSGDSGILHVAGSAVSFPTGKAAGTELLIGIRPEALRLVEQAGPETLTGTVKMVEHMGSDLYVHLSVPGLAEPLVTRLLAEGGLRIAHGQILHLHLNRAQMLLFERDGSRIRLGAAQRPTSAVREQEFSR